MSPPDLPGNTPVADIFQPVQVDLVKPLRHKLQVAVFHGLDSRLGQLLHLHEPLLFYQRFHGGVAAVVSSNVVGVGNDLHQIALLLQILHHHLPGLVAVQPGVLAAVLIDGGVVVHNVDLRQVVALAYLEVVGVVSRRDLHRTGPELFIYIRICHDGDLSSHQRQDRRLAYDIFVPLVIRMYRNGRIAQHGLRTGGSDLQIIVGPHDGIFNMPEMAFLLFVLYFRIGKRGLTHRTPVDDPGPPVNVAFLIKLDKYLFHRLGTALVHGETLPLPVAGHAQLL